MSHKAFRARKTVIAVGAALSLIAGQASAEADWTTYEIVNLDDMFNVQGTLEATRNGYGMALAGDTAIGISQGVNDVSDIDTENLSNVVIDDQVESLNATNSIFRPFVGNSFLFEQQASTEWQPTYVPLLENLPPVLNPDGDEALTARTDASYFGANAAGTRAGYTTALQSDPIANGNCDTSTDSTCSEFYYVRDFERRAFVQNGADSTLLVPPFVEYVTSDTSLDDTPVNVGGVSVAVDVNSNGLVAGYASTALAELSEDRVDSCISAATNDDEFPVPTNVCVQDQQNAGTIFYQQRGYLWQLNSGDLSVVSQVELPLGFTPEEDDDRILLSQALGVSESNDTFVVGRSNQVNGNGDILNNVFAQAWINEGGSYQSRPIGPTSEDTDRVVESIAYDVNDNGVAVGVVRRWIDGSQRFKFGVVDLNNADTTDLTFTEPNDFFDSQSDLSSRARALNNNGIVVGNIEIDRVRQLARRVRAFAYDITEDDFINLNTLLTCGSRGFVNATSDDANTETDAEGVLWKRFQITDSDNFSTEITYDAEITLVDANDIAEDGTIVATALVNLPRVRTETVTTTDDNGNDILTTQVVIDEETGKPVIELDANGNPTTNKLPRSVILKPTTDPVCTLTIEDVTTPELNERQGGGIGWAWLITLMPLIWWRKSHK